MAPIASLGVGDYIKMVVFSYHKANPVKKYQNTYEFRSNSIQSDTTELEALASQLAQFHAGCQHVDSVVEKVLASTYEAEEGGYDPLSFTTFEFGMDGLRGLSGQALPAKAVAHVKRTVATGRTGKIHIRLMLNELDVHAPAGDWVFQNLGAIQSEFGDIIADSGIGATLGASGVSNSFQMVMISEWGNPLTLGHRRVINLYLAGVTVTPTNHAHYDRA